MEETEPTSWLDSAVSREDGLRLLRSNLPRLSDELAKTLSARAGELRMAGEAVLSDDYSAWASETRALVTRRLCQALKDDDARVNFLLTQRNRFDDAFFDLCFRVASSRIDRAYELLEPAVESQFDSAAVAGALEDARREVEFLTVLGEVTDNSQYRAKATILSGTLLLFRSQFETREGRKPDAEKTAAEAEKALQLAAVSPVLPAELRALAEMRLASLAGPSKPDAMARHQEAALSIALAGNAWDAVSTVRRDRAYWAKERGDWQEVFDLYRQNIELSERRFWEARVIGEAIALEARSQQDYEGAVEACLELAKSNAAFYERALESAEQGKARAFLRGLATIGTALSTAQPRLQERRSRILRQMSETPPSTREQSELLLQALVTVEDQIWAHPRALALDMGCVPCTYDQMRALVPPNGVVLSYFTLPDRLLIFVLGEHGLIAPPAEVQIPRSKLARWAVELQTVIRLRGDYQSLDDLQRALKTRVDAVNAPLYLSQFHRILLEPVASHLTGKRLIIVVPHGVLSGLPFHAFSDSNRRALIEDAAIEYAPGLSVLRWCRAQGRTELNTCFAAGVSKLAGGPQNAKREAEAVAQVFGTAPGSATRTSVLQKAGDCDVIHLSCHSEMATVFTSSSGLQLEDGPLSQSEIAGMECRSTLVVLSACTTSAKDVLPRPGSEFAGLVGAFFRAGCPSVVASLWPLADAAAVPFAEGFYTALKKDRVNIAEALRQAQLAIKARAGEGYDDPYFWAPFSLWGNT